MACGDCERVDKFEDEEFGKGATEVGGSVWRGARYLVRIELEAGGGGKGKMYVASRVMYVPPIAGSAILA